MKLKAKDYSIVLHKKVFTELTGFLKTKKPDYIFIICDSNTMRHCLPVLITSCKALKDAEIIELEPGEESKDLNIIHHIWQTLTEFGCTRQSLVINLGGGVVSDIGGFAASTFKRGVGFINLPTTLLAMADASVGGKTGINFNGIKNHIGTITQPEAIFIYTPFLNTLPQNELQSGFAEIIKSALIKDKAFFFELLKQNTVVFSESVISKAIAIKYEIVKKDPQEKTVRKLLNFGHTYGHALESVFMTKEKPLLHGQAVGIGMMLEVYLSYLKKFISKEAAFTIIAYLKSIYSIPVLNEKDWQQVNHYLTQDKKRMDKRLMFVLLKQVGKGEMNVFVTPAMLKKAEQFYNSELQYVLLTAKK
jgi:3-dehydroquinate synthase